MISLEVLIFTVAFLFVLVSIDILGTWLTGSVTEDGEEGE